MCTALIIVYVCVAEGDVRFKRGFLSRIQFVSVNDSLVDVTSIFFPLPIFIGIFSSEPKIPVDLQSNKLPG